MNSESEFIPFTCSITEYVDFASPVDLSMVSESTCHPELGIDASVLDTIDGVSDPQSLPYQAEVALTDVCMLVGKLMRGGMDSGLRRELDGRRGFMEGWFGWQAGLYGRWVEMGIGWRGMGGVCWIGGSMRGGLKPVLDRRFLL